MVATTRYCSALVPLAFLWLAMPGYARQDGPPPAPASKSPPARADTQPLSLFPSRVVWTIRLNNLLAAPPAFDGVRGFFPIEGERVVAYDLALGARLWIAPVATTLKPAAGGDLVFVAGPDSIEALRAADGSLAWLFPLADPLAAPLAWDNGWLIAVTIHGSVLSFRANDGYLVWRRDIGSPAHAPSSFAADRVYVPTEDGRVVALRVDTGATVWDHRLGGAASDILALDDRLYVGSKDNYFYCLDAKDGSANWAVRTGGDVIGLPVVDEHRVYFVSLDNLLRGLNRRSGNQQWKRALPIRPNAGPVKASNVVIVTGLAPAAPAYRTVDGDPAGDLATGEEIVAVPYTTSLPGIFGPVVILVTRDIAKGATVIAMARAIEPRILTAVVPLRNPFKPPTAVGTGPSRARPSRAEPSTTKAVLPLPDPTMPAPPAASPVP